MKLHLMELYNCVKILTGQTDGWTEEAETICSPIGKHKNHQLRTLTELQQSTANAIYISQKITEYFVRRFFDSWRQTTRKKVANQDKCLDSFPHNPDFQRL